MPYIFSQLNPFPFPVILISKILLSAAFICTGSPGGLCAAQKRRKLFPYRKKGDVLIKTLHSQRLQRFYLKIKYRFLLHGYEIWYLGTIDFRKLR